MSVAPRELNAAGSTLQWVRAHPRARSRPPTVGRPLTWVIAVVALLLLPGGAVALAARFGPLTSSSTFGSHPALSAGTVPRINYTESRIYYRSSVDGFNLSYIETLPSPFHAARTYPLAIELHGLTGETVPIWGGLTSYVVPTTAQAAVNDGFILINPCTRTGSGWYVNSNFTGPQEQDILDALVHEQMVRHIGAVYLFGESMGSIGTLAIGLAHPTLFKGLGAIASFSDFFEMFAYLNLSYPALAQYLLLPSGGLYPNASGYARGIFLHLSQLRFYPENASGLKLYVANGAKDVLASNNLSLWPYQQENNTLVNRTCLAATTFAEPAGCTLPLATLAALHPGQFSYRYVFEPNGPHDYYLMNATDMFSYFLGHRSPGTYWGTWPVPTPRAPPQPLFSVATLPMACGRVLVGNQSYQTGDTVPISAGNHSVSFSPCGSRSVASVRTTGGVHYSSGHGTCSITASGAIVVRFA